MRGRPEGPHPMDEPYLPKEIPAASSGPLIADASRTGPGFGPGDNLPDGPPPDKIAPDGIG